MKIKVKLYNGQKLPKVIQKGDWIDIFPTENVNLECPTADTLKRNRRNGEDISIRKVNFYPVFIDLNMAMKLPDGYEAHILPRSSSFIKSGFILTNSTGIIDGSYSGNNDKWGLNIIPFRDATITTDKAIVQFKIVLSQKATVWQRIKWLFSSGKIEFIEVNDLKRKDRGGFGTTDK